MRLIFAGTPEFAAAALQAILDAGHEVVLVLTQPDRPAGRGMALQASPVKQLAVKHGIPVHQPEKLRTEEQRQPVFDAQAELMVVAAYGLILPQVILDAPRRGCLNIHGSLLPRWRGAAPIQRAIQAGDAETGITIMQMDIGLDTGAMLLKAVTPIADDDTAATLHDKLAAQGASLIVAALTKLEQGELPPTPQPEEGVTYAAKISKAEAELDWRLPAIELDRAIRAYNPFPGALSNMAGTPVKIWQARPEAASDLFPEPGTVVAADGNGVVVACGEGVLRLLTLQKPGGKRLPVGEFLRGFPLEPGARFSPANRDA